MYPTTDISLRPQYLGKRNWKLGCFVSNNYNHLKLLSENNFENNINTINTNNNTTNNTINNTTDFLKFNDNAFYNKTAEYIKNMPKYIEQYNECNYDILDKISHLYRNLLNSNDFYKVYIKKNSLRQYNTNNILYKNSLDNNISSVSSIYNKFNKSRPTILINKNVGKSNIPNDFDDDIIQEKVYNNIIDIDSDDCCDSVLSEPKDHLDFEVYDN